LGNFQSFALRKKKTARFRLTKPNRGSRKGDFIISSVTKKINPENPEPDIIRDAADVIRKGGAVLFPTKCLYGLGADALNPDAVDRIFEIKQRPRGKPILVLIHRKKELELLVKGVPPAASRIMDKFWPGGVTIVFEAKNTLPENLTAGTGKIGVRMAGHPAAFALAQAVNGPVTGTSANLAGQPGCSQADELDMQVGERLDLILDAGLLRGGAGSTIIDVTYCFPKILRDGAVPAKNILSLF